MWLIVIGLLVAAGWAAMTFSTYTGTNIVGTPDAELGPPNWTPFVAACLLGGLGALLAVVSHLTDARHPDA
jgi:hypothetical protein